MTSRSCGRLASWWSDQSAYIWELLLLAVLWPSRAQVQGILITLAWHFTLVFQMASISRMELRVGIRGGLGLSSGFVHPLSTQQGHTEHATDAGINPIQLPCHHGGLSVNTAMIVGLSNPLPTSTLSPSVSQAEHPHTSHGVICLECPLHQSQSLDATLQNYNPVLPPPDQLPHYGDYPTQSWESAFIFPLSSAAEPLPSSATWSAYARWCST